MHPPRPVWYRRSLVGLMLLAAILRLVYFAYTHRTWEDALITVQHSEDFARGMGLTHPMPAGEGPLHGFTSPLSVLIPLVGDLIHVGFGITLLRLVSVLAGAAAVFLGAEIALALDLPYAAALAAGAFLAVEHHQILWGMAGMETQVVTLCYLAVLSCFLNGNPWQKGVSLGFAMLARPDAAFLVLIALGMECWRLSRSRNFKPLLPILGVGAALYAPWLIFTKLYYGSVVPNTIIAKDLGSNNILAFVPSRLERVRILWGRLPSVFGALGPSYAGNGTGFVDFPGGQAVFWIMMFFLAAGCLVALWRRHAAALFLFAFVLTYGLYLTAVVHYIYGWYTVPVTAGAIIGCVYGVWGVLTLVSPRKLWVPAMAALGIGYIACIAWHLPATFTSDKFVQSNIEVGVRKHVGEYLHDVSYPNDTIASESLGYFGYYSGRVMYDYPGLCSRPVIQYLRDHPNQRSLQEMAHHLQPTYVVLRPWEEQPPEGGPAYPWLKQDYDLVRVFTASPGFGTNILFNQHNIDWKFDVFRRKGAPYRGAGSSQS